jgi:hypothetical protein
MQSELNWDSRNHKRIYVQCPLDGEKFEGSQSSLQPSYYKKVNPSHAGDRNQPPVRRPAHAGWLHEPPSWFRMQCPWIGPSLNCHRSESCRIPPQGEFIPRSCSRSLDLAAIEGGKTRFLFRSWMQSKP